MILSIGTDIVEIDEIKKSINMSNRFLERVFTKNEQDYCEHKTNKFEHYAARFAAKEAVMKALGTGWDKGVQWNHIEVCNNNNGKPEIMLHGKTLELFNKMEFKHILISLSHSKNFAVASAILKGI